MKETDNLRLSYYYKMRKLYFLVGKLGIFSFNKIKKKEKNCIKIQDILKKKQQKKNLKKPKKRKRKHQWIWNKIKLQITQNESIKT